MTSKSRRPLVLILLVTFLVAGLLPAAGGWSCPDGTACVGTMGQELRCAGNQCAMACCRAGRRGRGCSLCARGISPSRPATAGARQRALGEPAQCRYRQPQRVGPALAPARGIRRVTALGAALPPVPSRQPSLLRLAVRRLPIRGSPRAAPVLSLSSPRAPPALTRA